MINLETPRKFAGLVAQAHQMAETVFRPISRKYDEAEHSYPKELDTLAALIDGMNDGSGRSGSGANGVGRDRGDDGRVRNGSNMSTALGIMELSWGDVGLVLSMPRQGLGNAAIAAVANSEQRERFDGMWAAMAITEPEAGSDSAAIRTTAVLDEETGDYVLNGEKIFVTSGERADLIVVWATLDRSLGRAAVKSFVVERDNPGLHLERLEQKLGIRASDTANFRLENCRVPPENLLGSPEVDTRRGFAGVMKTFDNTRPLVAAMAVGLTAATLQETRRLLADAGVTPDPDIPAALQSSAAAELLAMQAEYEAARLLTLEASWMADNAKPNSLYASMAKAKAGRICVDVAIRCVRLCGSLGYGEELLLEKWARDAKILDLFEGTQEIQLLIIARLLLGKTSADLK